MMNPILSMIFPQTNGPKYFSNDNKNELSDSEKDISIEKFGRKVLVWQTVSRCKFKASPPFFPSWRHILAQYCSIKNQPWRHNKFHCVCHWVPTETSCHSYKSIKVLYSFGLIYTFYINQNWQKISFLRIKLNWLIKNRTFLILLNYVSLGSS